MQARFIKIKGSNLTLNSHVTHCKGKEANFVAGMDRAYCDLDFHQCKNPQPEELQHFEENHLLLIYVIM